MNLTAIKETGLLSRFNEDGHWFTSYPSLNHWTEDFKHADYEAALCSFIEPLHLYLHIPFCKKLCHYCICNIVISNDRAKIQYFLDHLLKEIDLLKAYKPDIRDMHFGGGTPSHLDQRQFSQLCEKLNTLRPLKEMDEVAMEIDPRTVTVDDLKHYASNGITRISFGVQDFDLKVQQAINRVQPPDMIENLLEARSWFKSVNFDLLYGLPFQTQATFADTLAKTIKMRPERITLLKYCHVPELRRHMRLINAVDLPPTDDLCVMFVDAIERLTDAGYLWKGLDHFCLPTDSLARKVERTFNGFSSGTPEMIGVGPTTTGAFGNIYCQAHYDLNDYYDAINRGEFPILRGYRMTPDDLLRRKVIFRLLCIQQVDFTYTHWYFEKELEELANMPELCTIKNYNLTVTPYGRLLLRNLCKVFDVKDIAPEHHKIAQRSMTRRASA